MKYLVYSCCLMSFASLCWSQSGIGDDEKGLLFNRRPLASPCEAEEEDYDPVYPKERTALAVLGGAAVGGIVGGAAGYHLGMKNGKPVIINNNIYNHQSSSPCIAVSGASGGGTGGWGGGGGGGSGGGGIISGILSNHPILSNILQGGLLGGGGGGNRRPFVSNNRNIRQFQRQVVRPISRIFK